MLVNDIVLKRIIIIKRYFHNYHCLFLPLLKDLMNKIIIYGCIICFYKFLFSKRS